MVPVLVMEDAGVMESVRRSASLLRRTWGEQLVSGLAFGWLVLLYAIPGIVLGALCANGYPIFIVPAILWFAGMMARSRRRGKSSRWRSTITRPREKRPRATTRVRWARHCGGGEVFSGLGVNN